jgi:hypothetical protein
VTHRHPAPAVAAHCRRAEEPLTHQAVTPTSSSTAPIKPTLVPMEPPRTTLHSTSSKGVLLSSKGVLLDIPLAASPGTTTKVHLPQQACSKGGAAFPRQLTGPHEYPHLRQNSGSNRFPQRFPFGGAHNAFLHAEPSFMPNYWPMGFPPQEVFPFYFLLFPTFLLNIIFHI